MHNETAVSQPAAMKSQEMHSDGDTKMPEQQDEKEEAESGESMRDEQVCAHTAPHVHNRPLDKQLYNFA